MTEEEKKKQEQQAATATQQPDAVEQSIKNLEDRAAQKREFANSPISIDTSGQTDWMAKLEQVRREYTENPEQQAAREKREKRNRRIAAISDGLVALSNVAGAMAGATPIKQAVTLSDAHRKAVERAAQRRRENAARYETARRYLSGLQQQQDKLNADRYQKAVKAKQDAGKQADNLEGTAAKLRQSRENADRNYGLQKEKFEEQKEHNRKMQALQAERNSISRSKGGGSSEKKEDELRKAYAFWERLTPKQKKEFRDRNNRGRTVKTGEIGSGPLAQPIYGTQYMDDDEDFILNAYRQHEGWKSNQGGGNSGNSGSFNVSKYKRGGTTSKKPPLN